MFIILVYDINVKRVVKVLKKCRQYLTWVQNSVLEGELSNANYTKMIMELSGIIDKTEDSIIVYKLRDTKYREREIIGIEKGGEERILQNDIIVEQKNNHFNDFDNLGADKM